MKRSAGILLYGNDGGDLRVLLVHPGGPFWARRDLGAWSIPKGEYAEDEDALAAARREFEEELGAPAAGPFASLGELRQPSRKIVAAWACAGAFDPARLASNTFAMEWPPGSGAMRDFPEVDRADWFTIAEAERRILPGQRLFLERLVALLGSGAGGAGA